MKKLFNIGTFEITLHKALRIKIGSYDRNDRNDRNDPKSSYFLYENYHKK